MEVDSTQNTHSTCCEDAVKDTDAMREDCNFGQPNELPEGELLWPIKESQKPEVVSTAEEFMDAVLFQTHIDRVVVLPNGIELLRQQNGIPEQLLKSVRKSSTIRTLLDEITSNNNDEYRGRLWHYSVHGSEKEVKNADKSKLLCEKFAALKRQEVDGQIIPTAPIYISELRHTEKQWHPVVKDELVKTATTFDIYDYTPLSQSMPLWERSEGGIFFGERGTGSGFHIDQCMWSNVGRNWCGFKLFAIWPWADRFSVFDVVGKGKMLSLPLTDEDVAVVGKAKCIALLRPGDVFAFSGAQPHTAMVVGDGLNIGAYESFVPAHPEAVGLLARSNIKDMHPKMFWMDDEDLDELYEDVVDNMQRALRGPCIEQRLRSRLEECVKAMRERGDAYCKELWRQEDCGERRRRREEDSSSSAGSDCASESGGKAVPPQPETESAGKKCGNFSGSAGDDGPQCKVARTCGESAVVPAFSEAVMCD